MPDYYEVLGVSKEADEIDIKKAFRKMSLQFHPDRNPGEDTNSKFQDINEAFEVLGDPEKRQQYNMELQFGSQPQFGGMGQDAHDNNNIFNMMFGAGAMGGNPFGSPNVRIFHGGGGGGINFHTQMFHSFNKPEPVQINTEITIEQSYHGCTISTEFECWNVINNIRSTERKSMQLNVPAGIDDGETIVVPDQGNNLNNQIRGELRITVRVKNGSEFTRKGSDLHLGMRISLKEALCGFTCEFDHFNGKRICMNNSTGNNVIKPNATKKINGLGMIRDGVAGNLIVEFDIKFPDTITEEQRAKLSEIFE